MRRLPRPIADGLVYHALNRGNNRDAVFTAAGDFQAFLDALTKTAGLGTAGQDRSGAAEPLAPRGAHAADREGIGSGTPRRDDGSALWNGALGGSAGATLGLGTGAAATRPAPERAGKMN